MRRSKQKAAPEPQKIKHFRVRARMYPVYLPGARLVLDPHVDKTVEASDELLFAVSTGSVLIVSEVI